MSRAPRQRAASILCRYGAARRGFGNCGGSARPGGTGALIPCALGGGEERERLLSAARGFKLRWRAGPRRVPEPRGGVRGRGGSGRGHAVRESSPGGAAAAGIGARTCSLSADYCNYGGPPLAARLSPLTSKRWGVRKAPEPRGEPLASALLTARRRTPPPCPSAAAPPALSVARCCAPLRAARTGRLSGSPALPARELRPRCSFVPSPLKKGGRRPAKVNRVLPAGAFAPSKRWLSFLIFFLPLSVALQLQVFKSHFHVKTKR